MKRLKSVLCVPGHDLTKVDACRRRGADVIHFDLEDSVPSGSKDLAREIVKAHVLPGDMVRVNDWEEVRQFDIEGVTVVVPKAEYFGWYPERAQIGLIVETAVGLNNMESFLFCVPVSVVAFGEQDMLADFGCVGDVPELSGFCRLKVLAATRAHGKKFMDGPAYSLGDQDVSASVRRAISLGADYKVCLRPMDAEIVKAEADKLATCNHELEAIAEFDARGGGVFVHKGLLVSPPVVKSWRQ